MLTAISLFTNILNDGMHHRGAIDWLIFSRCLKDRIGDFQ
jgi:hypothetical protein